MPVRTRSRQAPPAAVATSAIPEYYTVGEVRKNLEFIRRTYLNNERLFYPAMRFDEDATRTVAEFCVLFVQGNHSKRISRHPLKS